MHVCVRLKPYIIAPLITMFYFVIVSINDGLLNICSTGHDYPYTHQE